MTFPDIPTVAGGRVLSTLQANTTTTRTFPDLSSLTKNSGDLLLALGVCYSSSTTPHWTSWGASFTEFLDSSGSGIINFGCAYKFSNGSETGTFTASAPNSGAGHFVGWLLSIPNAHASEPPVGTTTPGSGTTVASSPAALSPSWGADDTLWIALAGNGETSTSGTFGGISAAPTDYGDYVNSGLTADVVGGVESAVAFRQLNAASEDQGPFTFDLSNARNGAIAIAVRPAALALLANQRVGVPIL